MNRKYCVVTCASGIDDMASVSHPRLASYAVQCGAEFRIISERQIAHSSFHYQRCQIYDLLDLYERILHIDSDVLISSDAPNIFEIVPEHMIGVCFEDVVPVVKHRRNILGKAATRFGCKFRNGYPNTGVLVVSKRHKELFSDDFSSTSWNEWGFFDVLLRIRAEKLGFDIFQLDAKFNFMSIFQFGLRSRFSGFFIHYAGIGFNRKCRVKQMISDKDICYGPIHKAFGLWGILFLYIRVLRGFLKY